VGLTESLAALALLGGLIGLEGTALGQFMLSRPLVAGSLAGLVLGDPAQGFALGALLEVYLLVSFPFGGARFPEGGIATLVAVASATSTVPGGLAVAVAAALVWGQVAGLSITAQRGLNGILVPSPHPSTALGGRVVRGHLAALGLEFLRGAVLTTLGVVVGRLAVTILGPHWPVDPAATRGFLLLGGLVSVGVLLRSLGGLKRRLALVGAGLGLGLAMGILL
jgi:PTS system mannose-specific IIC component